MNEPSPVMWLEHLVTRVLNGLLSRPPKVPRNGLHLGRNVEAPHSAVVLPERHRCEHAVIVGKTGSGKTYLLESVASQLANRSEGFVFFDFHGDTSLALIGRLRTLPDAATRLIVIDPSHPTRSPGINVLESEPSEGDRFRKVSELSSILRQRWGADSFGARTEELLRNSLYTLASAKRTLADLPKLLTDAALRRSLTRSLDHPDIQAYWLERYEPLSDAMKGAFREPLLNRVTAFLTEPAARHLLCQPDSTVHFEEVMRRRQWLIIRLPKGRLREHAHTLGNLLFAQLQFATFARERLPRSQRQTFTLLCDEVQNLAENDLATLVTEGRKFGISVVTANQFWEQLPRELRGCLLSASSHICFRVSSADAHVLASELSLDRRSRLTLDLTTLERGEAIARLGNEPVARFRVPKLPDARPATDAELLEAAETASRLRADIERQLRDRLATPSDVESVSGSTAVVPDQEGHHGW